jgi:hypothetical protein
MTIGNVLEAGALTEYLAKKRDKQNAKIINPETGKLSFGFIPENSTIASGEIYLRLGFIGVGRGFSGGFGARHIWDKHSKDLSLSKFADVPSRVAELLLEGCDVLVDSSKGGNDKPIVLNTSKGMVVLTKKGAINAIEYSIVSAYGRANHPGTVVATLKKPE